MEIRVDILGDKKVAAALKAAPGLLDAELRKAVDFSTLEIANTAKEDHPYTDRTGNLTNSIGIVPIGSAFRGRDVGVAQAVMGYAEAVEATHPYMRPAFERRETGIIRRINAAAQRAVRKAGLA